MNRRGRRLSWAAAAGALAALAVPSVVRADAAGPTDYLSEIVSIVPAAAADVIDVSIEGGDAFVAIEVTTGHEVVVLGYDHEPYVLIDGAGEVFHNTRSFATYYNEERYGGSETPDVVDNDATPEWERIGGGGSWAWHDHRAHWMGSEPPFGLEPGEALPTQIVPIELDGSPVAIEVRTTLVASPSRWPAAFGVLLGLAVVLAASLAGPATVDLVAVLLAGLATWVGVAQFRSLPAATGPLIGWWMLPAAALASALAVIVIYGRWRLVQHALLALAGLQLVVWAIRRRSGLTAAVLPTDLPFWFDRTVTAAAFSGGVMITVVGLRAMFATPLSSTN